MGLRGNFLFKSLDRYIGISLIWFLGLFTHKSKKLPEKIDSILIIKLSALGDTILLMPILRALRDKYPKAKITAICTKINLDVLKVCPYINEVLIINIRNLVFNPFSIIKLFKNKKFDLALDFDQWTRISPLLAFFSGALYRIGFKTNNQYRHYLYTHFVEHSQTKHELDCFADILKVLEIKNINKNLEFWVDDASKHHSEKLLLENGLKQGDAFIVFHPETPLHGGQRQWPAEKYVELGKKLSELNKFKILIAGTEIEKEQNSKIVNALLPNAFLMHSLSLGEYAAILSKAKMFISGNTGIMHLASALNIPVIALHGPTNPKKWGPLGNKSRVIKSKAECSPCLYLGFEYGCKTNKCMQDISVDEVFEEAKKVANSIPN
ncbi:MAG: glycosyltransferase family 9 protein [Elusimicrobia bacterium]|nr:glycosyltransferase family 9 protein [Elusimicrobiota bacterium]